MSVFWQAFWPAAALVIGALGSEFRNILAKRSELKRQERVDAISELTGVITTLKQEQKDAAERHQAALSEIRDQHSDCQEQYKALKKEHDELKEEHTELKKAYAGLSSQVDELRTAVRGIAPGVK
jgi:chromosome segregation ATPase